MKRKYCYCGTDITDMPEGTKMCLECEKRKKWKKPAVREVKHELSNAEHKQCETCEYRTYHAPWDAGMYCDYQNITDQFKISIEGYQPPPNCTVYKRRSKKSE